MKTQLNFFIVIFIFCGTFSAWAGHEGANGGDETALEFRQTFNKAMSRIMNDEYLKKQFATRINLAEFSRASATARILTTMEPLLATTAYAPQESVALNWPERQTIQVNRSRWKEIMNPFLREGISLHEFLSLQGLESTGDYTFSATYVEKFGIPKTVLTSPSATSSVWCNAWVSFRNFDLQSKQYTSKTESTEVAGSVLIPMKTLNDGFFSTNSLTGPLAQAGVADAGKYVALTLGLTDTGLLMRATNLAFNETIIADTSENPWEGRVDFDMARGGNGFPLNFGKDPHWEIRAQSLHVQCKKLDAPLINLPKLDCTDEVAYSFVDAKIKSRSSDSSVVLPSRHLSFRSTSEFAELNICPGFWDQPLTANDVKYLEEKIGQKKINLILKLKTMTSNAAPPEVHISCEADICDIRPVLTKKK